jgi:diacylglycerol O-acyltransferase
MSPLETIMWRAETNPSLKSSMVALEILESAPNWNDLVETHRRAVLQIPRLRQRVVEPPVSLAAPRWSADPTFGLHRHLRRGRLPVGAGWQDLFTAVEQLATEPFDRRRPPWEAVLYDGLPGGRAAYALKLHHASTDGLGTMQLMLALHGPADAATTGSPADPAALSAWTALAVDLAEKARATPSVVRRVGAAVQRAADAPLPSVRRTIRYTESLLRVLASPAAPPSALLADRSTTWRFAALDVDLDGLRRAAKAAGGSVNDAYLAALLGGYRRYHEAQGFPLDAIPMAIPISVRRDGDPGGGNRFASARLCGPVGVVDPAERMSAIGRAVREARSELALDHVRVLSPLLAALPAPAIGQLAAGLASGNDLQASNVPGAQDDVFLAGSRVERLYPFAPLPGCPAMITLVSHGDTCCVGVNYDPAAFTDGDLFLASLEAGFTEVLALAGAEEGSARWVR